MRNLAAGKPAMTDSADSFDAAFTKAVDLGNQIAEADREADLWDVADGLLAGGSTRANPAATRVAKIACRSAPPRVAWRNFKS
jgi:hypothetical protein